MKTINRNHCVLTKKEDLELLYSFSDFPVFMGCVEQGEQSDLKTNMDWYISKSSGSIQLNPLIPLEILYADEHQAGTIGGIWAKHHKEFAEFIYEYKPKAVLEIGGAHGILSCEYHLLERETPWTIYEPNPTPVENCKAKFIKGFFDETFQPDQDYTAIVHSQVVEHLYDPLTLFKNIASFSNENTIHFISAPNMDEMLKRKYTNAINFEHTFYLPEKNIEYLLQESGFEIIKKQYFMEDHSIFYATKKQRKTKKNKNITLTGEYDKNKKIFDEYVNYHQQLIADINEKIKNINTPLYLFGAHIFAQYLIAFGLNTDKIIKILDNSPQKQGKRLYGTSLMVDSPHCLAHEKNPVVILKAGVYNEEIKKDILENINPNTKFIE